MNCVVDRYGVYNIYLVKCDRFLSMFSTCNIIMRTANIIRWYNYNNYKSLL